MHIFAHRKSSYSTTKTFIKNEKFTLLKSVHNKIVIIGSDNDCISRVPDTTSQTNYSNELKQMVQTFNLTDTWTVLMGNAFRHTSIIRAVPVWMYAMYKKI